MSVIKEMRRPRFEAEKPPVLYPTWDSVPELMNLTELTALLRVSRETARKWCKEKIIPCMKINGVYRIEKDAVREMVRKGVNLSR